MEKWFANKGQVVQVIASVLGGLLAIAALIALVVNHYVAAFVIFTVAACAWTAFSIYMFARNRKTSIGAERTPQATTATLGKISFDYLPHESPLSHGWAFADEGANPTAEFSRLSTDAPVHFGLSIKPTCRYALDYFIKEAQYTKCNRLIFAARFGTDGVIYTQLEIPSTVVGAKPLKRWIQFGVNIGPTRFEESWTEGIVELVGNQLRDGWMSFDVSLDDAVAKTFGKQGFFYGDHGKLLRIRLRGTLSLSEIELYRA